MRRRYVFAVACLANTAFAAWGILQSSYGPLPKAVYALLFIWGAALIAITLWALRRW